ATVKVAVALVAFPVWTALVLAAAGAMAGVGAVLGLAVVMPLAGWAAIHFQESLEEALEDLAIFFRLGLRGARQRDLLARRAELARQIDTLIQEHDTLVGGTGEASAG